MSRFNSTPNIRLTSSTLSESTVNTSTEEKTNVKGYSVNNVRVKTQPLHVPLVNRSHKLQLNALEQYDKDNYIYKIEYDACNQTYEKDLTHHTNMEEASRAGQKNLVGGEEEIEAVKQKLPKSMLNVLSPIQETSSLHNMLQSYNEECEELASLIATYTPFKSPQSVKEENKQINVPHVMRPQLLERSQELEYAMSKEHDIAPELIMSPMSIDTCSTVHNALIGNNNNKQCDNMVHAKQRNSSRFSSAYKPLAPPSLHDIDIYESINENSTTYNQNNIMHLAKEHSERESKECEHEENEAHKVLSGNHSTWTQEQSNAWLTFLLNGCGKITECIEEHEQGNSMKEQCEQIHSLHSSILEKLTLLQELPKVDRKVNDVISDNNSSSETNLRESKKSRSQMCVQVSNDLATFVALLNTVVKELCQGVNKKRGLGKSKRKHSIKSSKEAVTNDNYKLASALVDSCTLRHEAVFCAERSKLQNALVLSEERRSALEMEKEHLLMELDKARNAYQELHVQNNTLVEQYKLLKDENRTLRVSVKQIQKGKVKHVKSTNEKESNEQLRESSLYVASSSSSSSSSSLEESNSSSLLSDSTALPKKVKAAETQGDNVIAALKKELQTVNDENDSMHSTINALQHTISKHHRILQLIMEHYKAAYFSSPYHSSTSSNNNVSSTTNNSKKLAKQKLVSSELIAHILASDNNYL